MLKDGKYRYTLQFGPNSKEEVTAGNLLDRLGRRKSTIVVKALNEYLQSHPELMDERTELQIQLNGIPMDVIENRIRELVEEKLSGMHLEANTKVDPDIQSEQVSDDIMDMLGDLDLFT